MPLWGDESHDWDGIDECIDILYNELKDSEVNIMQLKEKFGDIRMYCSLPTKKSEEQYRAAYEKAVEAHPELAEFILSQADYRELLVGIVKEEDCDHPQEWVTLEGKRTCGVCGRVTFDENHK